MQEEDFLIHDEIYKSRLASIKRVSLLSFFDCCFSLQHITICDTKMKVD